LVTACGEAAITTDPGAQPSVASEAASSASGAPSEPQTAGSQALAVSGLDGGTLYGVAASRNSTVAVGSSGDAPAAWTSGDGVNWQPAVVGAADGVPQLRAAAFSQDQGIAFGGDDMDVSQVWTSTDDGLEWVAGSGAAGVDGRVNALGVDGDTWLAVGDQIDPESGESAGGRLWTSDGGQSWQATSADLATDEGTISDVAAADGTVVVVGFDIAGGKVWTGTAATLQPVADEQFEAVTMQGVATTDDGFVVLGQGVGDLQPIAWTSPDGIHWTRLDLDPAAFPPEAEIHDLTTVDGVLVAVGASPEGGVVWTSEDGKEWARAAAASAQ
jgi:hypothetical protein